MVHSHFTPPLTPRTAGADWFNNDVNFSEAVQQALGLRQSVVAYWHKLPLAAKSISLVGWKPENDGGAHA